MNLLTQIKDSISDITIRNLSGYIEEDVNGTRLGLDLGLNAFLAFITKHASTEKNARNLLGILNDGGHTGDVIQNMEVFSENKEKTRLLETIGGNIVNHFLEDKIDSVCRSISQVSGIKIRNSKTLLNLAAPLVLGYLGRAVREENLNAADLRRKLMYESDDVLVGLPLGISELVKIPRSKRMGSMTQKHSKAVSDLNRDEERKGNNIWGMIIPWILLVCLGLVIYYFTKVNDKKNKQDVVAATVVPESAASADFLPIDTLKREPKTDFGQTPVTNSSAVEFQEPEKTQESAIVANSDSKQKTEAPPKESARADTQESRIPVGFSEIKGKAFPANSAEVIEKRHLQELITELKDTNKKLILIPLREAGRIGEDRAFAVRDFLLENGVSLSKIEIRPSQAGNNSNGFAFKIDN